MSSNDIMKMSKRERQIMDVVYQLGEATVQEVLDHFPDKVGLASLQKLIRVVESKGHLKHRSQGYSHIYSPTIPRSQASEIALQHTLKTFFQNSAPKAMAALMDITESNLSENDINEISAIIQKAEERRGNDDE